VEKVWFWGWGGGWRSGGRWEGADCTGMRGEGRGRGKEGRGQTYEGRWERGVG
jgi:hypothetical protein